MTTIATDIFTVRPYTSHCRVIEQEAQHAVIGVSPGNSFFTAETVTGLAHWAAERFARVDLVYTDLYIADMYEALGYSPDDARRKAVKNLRGVRAKVSNAALAVDPDGARVRAQPVSALTGRPEYRRLSRHVETLMTDDAALAATVAGLVDRFLRDKVTGRDATDRQREVCTRYILAELPLFIDSPAIFGVASSLNCYHQVLPLADLLYGPGHGLRASRNQGHGIIALTAPEDAQ
ncbi:tRNA-dependent cyclodipeptide synthase [Streptomyces sp. NPDC052676]|uniref:tRNA-dependent cyclodipeptide synthase n=1 Tax=Streptomyces sp. NPDC052676 TaxID=3154953 RepID=UPI00341BD947